MKSDHKMLKEYAHRKDIRIVRHKNEPDEIFQKCAECGSEFPVPYPLLPQDRGCCDACYDKAPAACEQCPNYESDSGNCLDADAQARCIEKWTKA